MALLLFAILLFLFPLSVYLAVLAGLNRRERPAMVAGVWDYVGLLFGLSGFLLIAAPAILYVIYLRSMPGMLARGVEQPVYDFFLWSWARFGLAAYYIVLVALVAYSLWVRTRAMVVYNIKPETFDHVFGDLLTGRGFRWSQKGNKWYLDQSKEAQTPAPSARSEFSEHVTAAKSISQRPSPQPVALAKQRLWHVATLDVFDLFWNVTIWWHQVPQDMRVELERDLRARLQSVPPSENPAAGWLLAASGVLFGVIIVCVVGLVLFTIFSGS